MNKNLIIALTVLTIIISSLIFFFIERRKQDSMGREPITITQSGLLEKMSIDDLIAKADVIIIGEVANVDASRWNTSDGSLPANVTVQTIPSGSVIFTDTNIVITQVLKGETTENKVRIRTFGGQVGQDQMIGEDAISFESNQTYLLFLTPDAGSTSDIGPQHYLLKGSIQGMYKTFNNRAISVSEEFALDELLNRIHNAVTPDASISWHK